MDFSYTLAGLVVGTAVGMTGIGGSALLAPILTIVLGLPPSLTVGTDLVYSVPTKILASVLHARRRNVDWNITKALLVGGVPGAIVGLATFAVLRTHLATRIFEQSIAHAIGVAVLLACIGIVLTFLPKWSGRRELPPERTSAPFWQVACIGALVGFLVSVTSVGAGSVTLPLLTFTLREFSVRKLIGSEIAFGAFLVPLAAVGHIAFHNVNWPIAIALVLGSLPGVWIGTSLASTLGDRWLRAVIAGLLALSGLRLV